MHKFFLVLSILLLAAGCSQGQVDIVDQTIKCEQLLSMKKDRYFGGAIGQMKTIYNQELKTCLVMNIYNNHETDQYSVLVLDMQNDKTLYSFLVNKGQLTDNNTGDGEGQAFKKLQAYGFQIN